MKLFLFFILILIVLSGFSQKKSLNYIIEGDSSKYILDFKDDSTVIKRRYIISGVVWEQTKREYRYEKRKDSLIIKNFYGNKNLDKIFIVKRKVIIDKNYREIGILNKYYKKRQKVIVFFKGTSLSGMELKRFIVRTNNLKGYTLSHISKYEAYQKYGFKSLKKSVFKINEEKFN